MQKPMFGPGSSVSLSRTIGEADVALFGGLTHDLGPNHMDAEYSRKTAYGRRVVHGAYLVGLASGASTLMGSSFEKGAYRGASYGYDRVRFVRPVFIGDTITITYTIRELIEAELKTLADVIGTNQDGTVVFAAVHIAKGLPKAAGTATEEE